MGPLGDQGVGPQWTQGGPVTAPPPTENAALPAAPSALDIEPRSIKTLDRVFSADPKDHERGALAKVRDLISHAADRPNATGLPYGGDIYGNGTSFVNNWLNKAAFVLKGPNPRQC